ncbi:MAG: YdeI/OmpD-associated family protein [Bacteroidia bacterium]|nr:YdeI/OmpD-associated family protein [Bacteroidia bacterium]
MAALELFFENLKSGKEELLLLRQLALDCGLVETQKWGFPCYQFEGKNKLVLQAFKNYCAVLFLEGFKLSDPSGILVKTGVNTQKGRQFRPESTKHILQNKEALIALIQESKNTNSKTAQPISNLQPELPGPLIQSFEEEPEFQEKFYLLSPGKQRAYLFHFNQAKQEQTCINRIQKCKPKILQGKGLLDK